MNQSGVTRSRVLRTADDLVRLEIAGGRVVERGGVEQVVPNLSRADLSAIQFGSLPHESSLEGLVSDLYPAGTIQAKRFFDERKIVTRVLADGTNVASVTSNVWDKLTAPLQLPAQPADRWVAGRGQRRVYELASVLTDVYLLEKFQLSPKQVSTARSMAIANASAAAAYLQGLIRENVDFVKYEVTAGKYARSKKWARASIISAATDLSTVPVHIESAVIGDNLFMYGPGDEQQRWSVFGPLWYAGEIKALYSVVSRAGPAQACFALGVELTLLGIDVTDAGVVVCPTVELHAGPQHNLPARSSAVTQELLSAAGRARIAALAASLEPVFVDGEQVACAVRVSQNRILVNSHVLDAGDRLEVASGSVAPQRMVSKDLWVARSCKQGFQFDWPLRNPVVGEQVVVCYLKADQMQYTSPMSVRTSDGVTVVMSLTSELKSGMSGGAIVALHDMALLGVYSGAGAQQAMGAVFSQEHYTDLCTSDAASDASRLSASAVDGSLYEKLKSRGLGRMFDRVVESLQPMYDGLEHVGMGFQVAHDFRTTCNVEAIPLTVGVGRRNLVFGPRDGGVFTAHEEVDLVGPTVVRRAQYGEKAFVVGRDSDGPYTSDLVLVRHVGVAGKTFMISDVSDIGELPLQGGLVMAMSDGAVVGQYDAVVANQNLGCVARCVSVEPPTDTPRIGVSETVVEWIAKTFPMLNPGTWPAELMEEVFTHSSVGRYEDANRPFNSGNRPLAYVGDAVAKMEIGLSLRESGVPSSQWQKVIEMHQTDRYMAQVCEEIGLEKWLRLGRGVSLPPGAKAHASVLEALLAAAHLQETTATVHEFCLALGLVARDYGSVGVYGTAVKEMVDRVESMEGVRI